MQKQEHRPVLLEEVIQHLRCTPGEIFVDGTVGGGGHAQAILDKTAPEGRLVGMLTTTDLLMALQCGLFLLQRHYEADEDEGEPAAKTISDHVAANTAACVDAAN